MSREASQKSLIALDSHCCAELGIQKRLFKGYYTSSASLLRQEEDAEGLLKYEDNVNLSVLRLRRGAEGEK